MTGSGEEKEFVSYVLELMQSIGPVRARAMFGGHGIFLEELMFGLVTDSVLFLKVDKENEGHFKARVPLIKSIVLLAYRLVRNQDSILKACKYLVKNTNEEYGQACKPLRARPEGYICHVAKLVKD